MSMQVLLATNFQNFPATAVTVEFWMWSVDGCNEGVPFSYATGPYAQGDNSFLIYSYNNWYSLLENSLPNHLLLVARHW